MPDAPEQTSCLKATLDVGGNIRIAGELRPAKDGKYRLGAAQLVAGTPESGKLSIRTGTRAQLLPESASDALPVLISSVASDNLVLELREPDSGAARALQQSLSAWRGLLEKAPPLQAKSAEYSHTLDELRRRSLSSLADILDPFMIELQGYVLDLSARIKPSKDGRNLHYEAAVSLRNQREDMLTDIFSELLKLYQDVTNGTESERSLASSDASNLEVIDLEEFENRLALDRLVSLGDDLYQIPLEALQIRLAKLVDTDPRKIQLPVAVAPLCKIFHRVLTSREVPREVTSHIFDFFARHVIRKLDDYYDALNDYLIERNIAQDLEQQIRTKGSLLKSGSSPRRPQRARKPKPAELPEEAQTLASMAASLGSSTSSEAVAGAITSFSPENLYRSVVDALNFKREVLGMVDGEVLASGTSLSGTWDGTAVPADQLDSSRLADARAIASALGDMQRDSRVQEAVRNSNSLREYLASNRDQIRSLRDTDGLTGDSLNQLDLVDNLFGTISEQLDVTKELKSALDNLQIPLAKLALLDPRFFADRGHSARAVVDKLAQLAASANFPNKALEDRINRVVDDIVSDYESDSAVFERSLEELDRLGEQQERALSRNIERVVRIQEGQEKLQKARRKVGEEINRRIKPPAAPRVLLDLVETGWRDLMVLTHVKEGGDSPAWQETLKTLDLLSLWLSEQQQSEFDEDLLMQRGLEAETLIDMVGQQIATALPTNVSHQPVLNELRDMLAGRRAVDTTDISGQYIEAVDDPVRKRARVEDLPRLRRWIRRVEQLEKNTWLTYQDRTGKKRRMQLAWISEAKDRYIFVNERGQKIADLSAVQLARQLSRGMQPPAPADKLSVVDQSMYQTLEHVQKTLSFARNHDSLTKLINRKTFLEQTGRALQHAQRKGAQHAVLHLNIDQFSLVNEVYDQVIGDQVLLEFSKLLSQLHGKKASSARLDADSFAVLLLDRNPDQARDVAEKIRRDIEASSLDIEGEKVTFTVSVGVAPVTEDSPTVERILESAQMATDKAKAQGRNKVEMFDESLATSGSYRQEQNQSREDLEQALATERFVLRAQPMVQTAINGEEATGRHYELLLGLYNDAGEITSPAEFIQSAERYGFMHLVDRWVVREAFSWISQLMDAQKEVPYLAINLSGGSVTDDDFLEFLLEQISEFGVGTSRICFEITETGTITNLVKAADFVRAFRNIGCKFSIDDFGTGLASHNYLRELPVDYVKIDGTFVTGIDKNRNDYAMARSINDLAHFLGQETIAESVENDGIIHKLREIGVDYLQGWGVGRPKPLVEVTEDLSSIEK